MDIQIRSNGVAVNDQLTTFINRRATQLDHLIDHLIEAKLELRGVHNRVGPDTTVAQLTIRSGRDVLRAEEQAPDEMQAVDQVFDKLERQVRRVHGKRSRRRAPGQPTIRTEIADLEAAELEAAELDGLDDEEGLGELVRTKRFGLKPMDVEEAIEQMELLGHDFFLFHLVGEDVMGVVYRRRDGAYGLLIPHK